LDCGSVGQVQWIARVNQSIHKPAPVVGRLNDHTEQVRSIRIQRCADLIQIIRQAPGIQDPIVVITDDDETVVRMKVYATK
ncbi:hypothetical protein, partial [Herbaspirillum lusitanum]|uniref:hypothetical protein n=1 Tax=Herbaspirillum lusitanum TaxID=213312 RepID=UPI001EE6636B